jgi:hypothetical protein
LYRSVALKVVYLDILLHSAGGMVGTMHHVYFSDEPAIHMAVPRQNDDQLLNQQLGTDGCNIVKN